LFGSEASAGKSLRTDLATGKVTLPVLLLLEQASPAERARILGFLQHWNSSAFDDLMEALVSHDALSASRAIIHHHLRAAGQALCGLADSTSRTGLLALTEYLGQQTDLLGQL